MVWDYEGKRMHGEDRNMFKVQGRIKHNKEKE